MHITPDDIGAATSGAIIVLGALATVIGKGWQALAELRKSIGEVKAQTGPNGENAARIAGQKAADTSVEVLDAIHELKTGMGGIRDELRQIRSESGQTRSEVTEVRISVTELDRKHDALKDAADRTHRDLADGQKDLASQLDELTNPCGGWDYGDHVVPKNNQDG